MELWNRPMTRLLCAEALEGRWFLSGAAPAVADDAPASGAVQVLEGPEIDEAEEGETELETSQLPGAVVAALNARFPGAMIIEAELEEEDGVAEYGVTATVGGKNVEVTFAPDGSILEAEEAVAFDELPPALLEWLESNYPGAIVDEAALVTTEGKPTYEVTFFTPGQQPLEATLQVEPSPSPDPTTPSSARLATAFVAFSDAAVADPAADVEVPTDPTASVEQTEEAEALEAAEGDEADAPAAASRQRDTANSFPASVDAGHVRLTEALEALAIGNGAAVWVPQVADVLSDVLPFDIASIEHSLQQFLGQIDELAAQALTDTTPAGAALRLSIVVSLFAGVQLLLLDRRLRKGGPVVVFSGKNAGWSWVSGTVIPVPVRRRTNVFRK